MNKKHKGAVAELKACSWLLEKGYEVFRNISQHGGIDIIAIDPITNEVSFFDVKTVYSLKHGLPNSKTSKDVDILAYVPETDSLHVFKRPPEPYK